MTFYQELQLNQSGSKNIIRQSGTRKEKIRHTMIYLIKIAITMVFCFFFVAGFSMIFGNDNSVVGVAVLLCVMVFKNADFGVSAKESVGLLALFFAIMIVGPHAANMTGPFIGFLINVAALIMMVVLGCHNPRMSNQSTIVLSYLLLYGYDVTGESFRLRMAGIIAGGLLTIIVFYRNHRKNTYEHTIKSVIREFDMHTEKSRWQFCLIAGVPLSILFAELCNMPRAMWAGIATMSVIVPMASDMKSRIGKRIIGNICGGLVFLVLYFILPPSLYANIGIIGGIGVGLSVNYGWQAVFNTFGALAIATEAFGLMNAVSLRVIQNVYGVLFALLFCWLFNKLVQKIKEYNSGLVSES